MRSTSSGLPVNPDGSPAMPPQEQRARELLAQGRWRKARDEIKLLCKQDRAKYLPLLVQANTGLVRDMLAKGQVSEAQQTLAYLKTIAAPGEMRVIELELAGRSGDFSGQTVGLAECLVNPSTPLSETEQRRLVDQLVVAFQPLDTSTSKTATLAPELNAVHQALEAVAEGQAPRVGELLRPLAFNSVFSHWKLFLKGLAAFHRGDHDKAARFFAELPADSVPGRARRPYLIWLGQEKISGNGSVPTEPVLEVLCRFASAPEATRILLQAEKLWHQQRPDEMYRLLRQGIDAFPSEDLDWVGALSAFCYHCLFILPEEEADDYADYLEDLDYHHNLKNRLEEALILRSLCLYYDPFSAPEFHALHWRRYLDLVEELHGSNPRLASRAYAWLGDQLSRSQGPLPSPAFKQAPSFLDAPGAIKAYQKSIDLDPAHLEAHLKLAMLFELLKRTGDRNRLLDQMTRRFPESKPVLMTTGLHCIDRGAYLKGVSCIERARAIDRLDPVIPDMLMSARILLARQHYRERRPEKARLIFSGLEELMAPDPHHYLRSRWTIQLRRGLLEEWHGDADQAVACLTDARTTSPDPVAYCLLAAICWDVHAPRSVKGNRFEAEFRVACRAGRSAAQAALLLRIHHLWKVTPPGYTLHRAERMIGSYLQDLAASRRYTRDEVRQLIDLIPPGSPFEYDLQPLIQTILEKDPRDPLFRLLLIRLHWFLGEGLEDERRQLEQILEEAIRRRDDQAIQLARKEIERLAASRPLSPEEPQFGREDFEHDPELSQEDAANAITGLENAPGLHVLIETLRNASDADIRRVRKTLPPDMPEEVFDLLVDVARGKIPMPPFPPLPMPESSNPAKPARPPQPSKRPVPPADPNQLNLF
jgi:tetratricopeptide (TPR) repeat protein